MSSVGKFVDIARPDIASRVFGRLCRVHGNSFLDPLVSAYGGGLPSTNDMLELLAYRR